VKTWQRGRESSREGRSVQCGGYPDSEPAAAPAAGLILILILFLLLLFIIALL
jgi:hypothetical protein